MSAPDLPRGRRASAGPALAALVGVTLACGAPLELGSFSFDLEVPSAVHVQRLSDARVMFFAEHTEATIVVRRIGLYEEGVTIFARATTSDPEVFAIVRDDGSRVGIRTGLQGNATLDVRGADGAMDGVQIKVRPAAHVTVEPDWSNAPRDGGFLAAALVDEVIRLRVRVRDADGEELAAPGMPIRGEPTARVELVPPSLPQAVDVRFASRGRATLAGEGGAPLLVEVIDPEDVDAITLEPTDSTTRAGDRLLLRPLVTLREDADAPDATRPILARKHQLLTRRVEIVERSPGICRARITNERYGDEAGVGLVEVTNQRSGRCVFDVRLGETSATYDATTVVLPVAG